MSGTLQALQKAPSAFAACRISDALPNIIDKSKQSVAGLKQDGPTRSGTSYIISKCDTYFGQQYLKPGCTAYGDACIAHLLRL